MIPCIVTNASLFRLRPSLSELESIRQAEKPSDIADEVEWTWLYFEPDMELYLQNCDAIKLHIADYGHIVHRFPFVVEQLHMFQNRPNWILVCNIKQLGKAVQALATHFLSLETLEVTEILKGKKSRARRSNSKQ